MRRNRKRNKGFITALAVLMVISIGAVLIIYLKTRGNTDKMDLNQYYNIGRYEENAIPLIMDTQILDRGAYYIDGEIYISQDIAYTMIDSKLFWDKDNKAIIITTPTDIVTISPDVQSYSVNGKVTQADKVLLKSLPGDVYAVSLSFIQNYVNVEYEIYDNPKRVLVRAAWGEKFNKVKVTKDDAVRYEADRQSKVLEYVKKDDILYVLTDNVQSYMRYVQVMTSDGIIGYIRNMNIGKTYEEVLSNDYQGFEYTPLHMKEKINLGWLQVANRTANSSLKRLLNKTSGLNVVSPTWYTLADSNGEITSYASKEFVTYAHNKGIKVWVLVDDFSQDVKLIDIISNTASRTRFINNLVINTLKCGADGINIDFEHITEESSPYYLQFLRELRIKTRKNNLVLSTDSYVPLSYNAHYKIDEQNEFVDYVIIMAYDEHHSKSTSSGSVASISYTKTAIDKALEKVDKEKLVIAMPFYTRLWGEINGTIDSIETLGMNEAYSRVKNEGGKFNWDDVTKQYYAEYSYKGKTYKIWLENKASIQEKLKIITAAKVAGVGSWRIGYETSDVWPVITVALKNAQ